MTDPYIHRRLTEIAAKAKANLDADGRRLTPQLIACLKWLELNAPRSVGNPSPTEDSDATVSREDL